MVLVEKKITLTQFYQVIFEGQQIGVAPGVWRTVVESHTFLKDFAANKVIYGVNTGFGPMAQYRIRDEDTNQLQFNLIRSHAAGTGELLPAMLVKAAMLTRLSNLSRGKSGVHNCKNLLIEISRQ